MNPDNILPNPLASASANSGLLQQVFYHHPLPMWVCDSDRLGLLEANQAAQKCYGYSREEFLALPVSELFPQGKAGQPFSAFCKQDLTGAPCACPQRRKDGGLFEAEAALAPIDSQGRKAVLVTLVRIPDQEAENADFRNSPWLKVIHEVADLGLWMHNPENDVVSLDWRARAHLGIPNSSAALTEILERAVPEDRERIWRDLAWNLRPNRTARYSTEYRFMHPDGSLHWISIQTRTYFEGRGEERRAVAIVGTTQDITQKKEAESEQRKWADAFQHCAHGIALGDPRTHRLLTCNPAFARLHSKTVQELEGAPIMSLYATQEHGLVREKIALADQQGSASFETNMIGADGSTFPVQVELVSVRDGQGSLLYRVATVQDICQRRQYEAELLHKQKRLEEAEQHARLGSWEFDVRTAQGWWSQEMYRLTGLSPEDGVPSFEQYLQIVHPEDRESMEQVLQRMSRGEEQEPNEWRTNPEVGPVKTLQPSVHCERDAEGRAVRFSGTVLDVTARKKVEQALRARNLELSALYELSMQFRQFRSSEETMQHVLDQIIQIFQADASWIALIGPKRRRFHIPCAAGDWQEATGMAFPLSHGLSGQSVRNFEVVVTEDYSQEENTLAVIKASGTGPAMFVPLRSDVELIGALSAGRRKENPRGPFSPEEVRLLASIGELTGAVLRRQSLIESDVRRLEQLQALHRIDRSITGGKELSETLDTIIDQVIVQLGVDAASVLLNEADSRSLKPVKSRGFQKGDPLAARLDPQDSLPGLALTERRIVHLPDLPEKLHDAPSHSLLQAEGFVEYLAAPLITEKKVLGVLEVFHRSALEASPDWKNFLISLAEQTAIAVEHRQLIEGLEAANRSLMKAYEETIEGWSFALDLRDRETEGHTQRVTRLTLDLARAMGFSEAELVQVRRGALLHDIGKMGIPDDILRKQGPLTVEEWELMHQHPANALNLLSSIEYLRPALDIPHCHHEHWNGEGYPQGLKGEEIPLAARIFALVDVWDALTSNRPYRPAWTQEQVLNYLTLNSGIQFDPAVVEFFKYYWESHPDL